MTPNEVDPQIEVVFSRPAYRQGGSLVATVRVTFEGSERSPRSLIRSLEICALGRCRLDPRWHDVSEYHDVQLVGKNALLWGLEHDKNTVCFWATQPIDIMEYQERVVGRWDDVKPKPILLGKGQVFESSASSESVSLEDQQLSFTFQAHLPVKLPHSMIGTSCRYDYHVVLKLLLRSQRQARWMQVPFPILTKHPNLEQNADGDTFALNKFRLTTSQAVVHSSGLPSFVTATELSHPSGTLTVNRHGASHFRHIRRDDAGHHQTLRVADPCGKPVCILTVFGVSPVHPGSRIVLNFDFPLTHEWVPCHQVSACVQGEEISISRDGGCKRSRSHILSTAHSYVEPQSTEQIALHLLLPVDAPYTIKTDVVAISIRCLIDISVGVSEKEGRFENLRLEIPCEVTHSMSAYEMSDENERLHESFSIDELLGYPREGEHYEDPTNPASFQTIGISEELKILSLHMADTCGLRPAPTQQFET